jgi:O-antigen/teichoic acid export membrane protein
MRALFVTLLTTGGAQLANLISSVLAARLLLPEGRGEFQAAWLWPTTIAYLVLFGLNDSVLYFSANRSEKPRDVFAAGLAIGALLSLIAIAITYFIAIPWAYRAYRPEVRQLATLMLLLIPCHIMTPVFQELLRGQLRMGSWNLLRLSLGIAYVVFILLFYAAGRADIMSFGIAYLAAHTVPLMMALFLTLRSGWGALVPPRATVRRMLWFGTKVHSGAVVNQLNGRMDQMLIATALDEAALGLYGSALALSQATPTLANSIALVAYPHACAEPDRAGRSAIIGVYLRLTVVMMVLTTIVLWILSPWIIGLLYGDSFLPAVPVLRVLLLGVTPLAIREIFNTAFKAFERPMSTTKGEIVTLAVNAAALALLVPEFGLLGAAWAFVIVRWASIVYMGWLVRRDLGLGLVDLFMPRRTDWLRAKAAARSLWYRLLRRPKPAA